MPVYEYICETHGAFEAIQPMTAYADPCPCPVCGTASARVLLSMPRLGVLDSRVRHAHETNERAAHEPKSTRTHGFESGGRIRRGKTRVAANGTKSTPGSRPWMISH
ncbi:MAG: zinc ribbon domain-containing protein [Pseudomonadota bacterium]